MSEEPPSGPPDSSLEWPQVMILFADNIYYKDVLPTLRKPRSRYLILGGQRERHTCFAKGFNLNSKLLWVLKIRFNLPKHYWCIAENILFIDFYLGLLGFCTLREHDHCKVTVIKEKGSSAIYMLDEKHTCPIKLAMCLDWLGSGAHRGRLRKPSDSLENINLSKQLLTAWNRCWWLLLFTVLQKGTVSVS